MSVSLSTREANELLHHVKHIGVHWDVTSLLLLLRLLLLLLLLLRLRL